MTRRAGAVLLGLLAAAGGVSSTDGGGSSVEGAVSTTEESTGPFVRVRLEADGPVTVGEPVRYVVQVFVPTWFTGAPQYPELSVDGAMVLFQERGTNLNERVDGASFAGQQREYLVYPLRPGRFLVPDAHLVVRYAINARPSDPKSLRLPGTAFEATVPPEAAGLEHFIAASRFELRAEIEGGPEDLKVGDALKRTLSQTAEGTFAMMLPPLGGEPIPGLAAYPDSPSVTDSGGERGEIRVGRRVEATSYVMQEAGEFELPGVELTWWDTRGQRLQTASVPAVRLSVAPAPASAEIPLPPEELEAEPDRVASSSRWLESLRALAAPVGLATVLLVALVRLGRRHGPTLLVGWRSWRERRRESEPAHFGRFRSAALRGAPGEAYACLLAWVARRYGVDTTLSAFVDRSGDAELAREATALTTHLFGPDPEPAAWSGQRLAELVATNRRRPADGTLDGGVGTVLPDLNPR